MPGATVPKIGAGTLFKKGDGASPEAFTTVPGLFDIVPIGTKAPFVETTPISSTFPEHIIGMKEAPDLDFIFNDLPGDTTQAAFFTAVEAGTEGNYQIVFPNGRTAAFSLIFAGSTVEKAEKQGQLKRVAHAKQASAVTWSVA